MDYKKLLGKKETLVLPFLGGTRVEAPDRSLRLARTDLEPGFWSFSVAGRVATPIEKVEAPSLEDRPKVRGHFAAGSLVTSGNDAEVLELLPAEEPPALAPVVARRWHGGAVLFEMVDFEGEAEPACREALEEGHGIGAVRGVVPSLRAAFAAAVLAKVGRRENTHVSLVEARAHVHDVAERGEPAALAVIRRIAEERRREIAALAARAAEARAEDARRAHAERVRTARETVEERIEKALRSADGELRATRDLGNGNVEVTWRFSGQRFVSVVDVVTLQVVDAGVCLAGEDDLVTLESLPGVIREAIDTSRLVVTRT